MRLLRMQKLLVLILFVFSAAVTAQTPAARFRQIFADDQPKPTVLLRGVFHFAGEQVDTNTTPSSLRVDMLSPERRRQVDQLIARLAAFRPTKIVIEGMPAYGPLYDSLFRAYSAGKLQARKEFMASETVQIGFRLARELNLKTVFPVDAQAFRFKLSAADSAITFEKYKDQADSSFRYWDGRYDMESAFDDTLAFKLPLIPYLKYLNSLEKQARMTGRWLVTTKRGSNMEPIGADGFITRYFNRNVRIYSNIQRCVTSRNDRILVIYGNTHMYFLRTLFTASPEFTMEPLDPYLR
jgi:hypothetical protein